MDVLKHLTRILRSQDLNDSYISTANVLQMKEEAHDSGTGSDEEMIQTLQPHSKHFQRIITSEDEAEAYDNPNADASIDDQRHLITSANHDHCRHSVTSSDLDLDGRSLDLDSSDLEEEEEESVPVMRSREKRKRSQLNDDNDNDIEICELFRGRNSRLSCDGVTTDCPAGGVRPLCPALENIPFSGRNAPSPRKRYRPVVHRPSLDFYKMQKTCIVRRSHYNIHRQRPSRL